MKKEISALMVICLALTFCATSARAGAVSTSTARIDWTSLNISGNITWVDKLSQSHAYAKDGTGWDEHDQTESGWVDTSASASVHDTYGNAYTDDDHLYGEAYATANYAITTGALADFIYAQRKGHFTAGSDGLVTFSVNYKLWQQLLTDYAGDWAYGHVEATLQLRNGDTDDMDEDQRSLDNEVRDGGEITYLVSNGTLTASVWFDAGDEGNFETWVNNTAEVEVPEPATICLLSLGALSLLRRKHV